MGGRGARRRAGARRRRVLEWRRRSRVDDAARRTDQHGTHDDDGRARTSGGGRRDRRGHGRPRSRSRRCRRHRGDGRRWPGQGQQPNTLMFLRICRLSVTDPKFNEGIDCSLLSELNPNGTADGNGTIEMPVFRGENPDGGSGWGCFAESDAGSAGRPEEHHVLRAGHQRRRQQPRRRPRMPLHVPSHLNRRRVSPATGRRCSGTPRRCDTAGPATPDRAAARPGTR